MNNRTIEPLVTFVGAGKVHVYTGDGKGKTTAAFGLAMRAAGRGLRVLIIQFLKGRPDFGEVTSARRLPGVKIEQYGTERLVQRHEISEEDRQLARKAASRARSAIEMKECDLLILDEINVAVSLGLVAVEEVVGLLDSRPPNMELVLTGRDAPPELIERADYVTEMVARKHPYGSGEDARLGIEL